MRSIATLGLLLGLAGCGMNAAIMRSDAVSFNNVISSPIDIKIVKYWLDRGLDRRIALLLFFSAAEIVETRAEGGPISTIRIMNSPRDAIDVIRARTAQLSATEALRCDAQSDF